MRKILVALVVVLAACSGQTSNVEPQGDAQPIESPCDEALEALERYDSDPATPDNIEPTTEDMDAFNEAYAAAEQICSPGG